MVEGSCLDVGLCWSTGDGSKRLLKCLSISLSLRSSESSSATDVKLVSGHTPLAVSIKGGILLFLCFMSRECLFG